MTTRRINTAVFIIVSAFLSGCAAEIVPAGPDTYTVSASGGIYTQSSAGSRAKAFKAANEFCVKRGLVMVPVSVDERQYELGHHTANINLVFRALRPGDPEIKRPNIENPTTTQRTQ